MGPLPTPPDRQDEKGLLLRWFSNPWVGALGSIFSVLSVALAVYFYVVGNRTRELAYEVNPVETTVVRGGQTSTLRVLANGDEIRGDITAAQIAIWNRGTESIHAENVLKPLEIVLKPRVRILEASFRKASRDVIGASLEPSRLADGIVPISCRILEHNDGMVVQLIFAGPAETEILIDGVVEGQAKISRVEGPKQVRSPVEQIAEEHSAKIGLMVIMSAGLIMNGILIISVIRRKRNLGTFGRFLVGYSGFLVLCLLFFYFMELRQIGPPFGF